MARKRKKTRKTKATDTKTKLDVYFIVAVIFIVAIILATITNMNNGEDNAIVGKAFSYTGCTKFPCHIQKAAVDHKYAFSYKDELYSFVVTESDPSNNLIKYKLSLTEDNKDEGVADLFIDHMQVDKVEEPYIYLLITVKNKGDKNIYDAFQLRVDTLNEDDEVWKSTYKIIEGLDQDESFVAEISLKYDQNNYKENKEILYVVYVDPTNVIKESDESNNVDEETHKDN